MWTFHGTVCAVHVLINWGNTRVYIHERIQFYSRPRAAAALLLFPAWEKKNIQYSCGNYNSMCGACTNLGKGIHGQEVEDKDSLETGSSSLAIPLELTLFYNE